MQQYRDSLANTASGLPLVGATVQVNLYPAGTPATIYSDNGVTPIPGGTLTTDANGRFSFYAPNGHYQLVISGSGITTQTINDIIILDMLPADLSTSLPGTPGQPWNNGGVISVS
ncbi:carboxypeptidase-like regulatory domain-containing protein [Paraburkholderia bannensis]|uniref:carboxypeptidase-like regulatory domain-containing protein n=1 Tax=Paraburkholderia bannensis TaxID=765414 RepID=UPI0006932C9C|nr:carboxypeptidase-like regulatory domain-containing protein [Paraburkholderia bannensis]